VPSKTQKPWRTLAEVPLMGRFTREQWDEAFRALEAWKERKRARASRAGSERRVEGEGRGRAARGV
jgi:hypothetical protein